MEKRNNRSGASGSRKANGDSQSSPKKSYSSSRTSTNPFKKSEDSPKRTTRSSFDKDYPKGDVYPKPERAKRPFGGSFNDRPKRTFGSDSSTDRPKRSFDGDSERPKRSFGGDKPDFNDRPKRSYGGDSERPKRSFGDKPDFNDRPKRSYGGDSERPKRSFGGDKPDFSDRPKRSYGGDKPDFNDRPKRSYGGDSERPKRPFGDKSDFNDRPKRSFGDKPDFNDRPKRSFDSDSERPKRSFGGDKPDFNDRPKRPFGDKPDFNDRPKRSFDGDSERPKRNFGDKPDFNDRPKRSYGGDSERPKRSFGGDKPDFNDRPKRSYGGDSERPKRSFGGDKPDFNDRPKRSFDGDSERPKRSFGDKPDFNDRPKRSYGGDSSERPRQGFSRGSFDKKDLGREAYRAKRDEPKAEKKNNTRYEDNRVGKYETAPNYNRERMENAVPEKRRKFVKETDDDEMRLNRYISNAGVCSRRDADQLIASGQIKVNGNVITEMGYKVKLSDSVKYGSKMLNPEKPVYVIMNKPKGYITTTEDPDERNTVMDLVKDACPQRIYPVGRLDRNTTGLLLLTNDGELAEKLMHPSNEIRKIYQVELDKPIKTEDFEAIQAGIELEDGKIKPDELAIITPDAQVVGIEIHSGKNRIVRRIFENFGYEVTKLDRTTYAGLTKKDLPRGKWRFLTEKEVIRLKYMI